MTAFADELEREKARQRTYDAMARKARAGHVAGGRVFGYDNVEIVGVDGRRSHVERRINETEAAVIRRIFELCAAGTGYSRIAKLLNAERTASPRPQQGRPAGWAPSTVNEILHRPLYRGEIVWNRTRKRNRWGQQDQKARASNEWMRRDAPELRIVSEEVWQAAHDRLSGIRQQLVTASNGQLGCRRQDVESRFLLSGFARCALCGASFYPLSRSHGRQRAFFYGCSANHKRGHTICGNNLILRVETIDDAVLKTIGGDLLRPEVVLAVLDGVIEAMSPRTLASDIEDLRAELTDVERELARLTNAIAAGGELAPLLDAVKARQRRRDELTSAIAARESFGVRRLDRAAIEAKVNEHVTNWRETLMTLTSDAGCFVNYSPAQYVSPQ